MISRLLYFSMYLGKTFASLSCREGIFFKMLMCLCLIMATFLLRLQKVGSSSFCWLFWIQFFFFVFFVGKICFSYSATGNHKNTLSRVIFLRQQRPTKRTLLLFFYPFILGVCVCVFLVLVNEFFSRKQQKGGLPRWFPFSLLIV